MHTIAFLLVLTSGFFHAIWNLYAKKSHNKNAFMWLCQLIPIILLSPWALSDLSHLQLPWFGMLLFALSVNLHGFYTLSLSYAYKLGDLSQVYPIMRGISPLLVPILSVLILHESISTIGWIGVVCIVGGIFVLGEFGAKGDSRISIKSSLYAVGVGLFVTSYVIVDKSLLTYISPILLNWGASIGILLTMSWTTLRSGTIREEWSTNRRNVLIGGIIAPGGYLLFLTALSLAPVAQLAPMREIGTVFGALLGVFVLHEAKGTKRMIASSFITAGVMLLGLYG